MKKILLILACVLISQHAFANDPTVEEQFEEILGETYIFCEVGRWAPEGYGEKTFVQFIGMEKPKKGIKYSNPNRPAWVSYNEISVEFTDQRGLPKSKLILNYEVDAFGSNYDEIEKVISVSVYNSWTFSDTYQKQACVSASKIKPSGNFQLNYGIKESIQVVCDDLSYYVKCDERLLQ